MPIYPTRRIIHLDMDAFYASVETLDNPTLRGRPVVVGGNGNRGVVCAASYEARKFGVHSAMPILTARKLCPNGVFLPVRMARYQDISQRIMEIFLQFTPMVEPLSLDEAFLDVTASRCLMGAAEDIALKIKTLVRETIGLTVSAGVGTSKLVAKIASDLNKPDGLTIVPPGQEKPFLAPLPIGRLWGVGRATQQALALIGVKTIGDLSRIPLAILTTKFGKAGLLMHESAKGIDHRPVEPRHEVKSIGHEETFSEDLHDRKRLEQELLALCLKVGKRTREKGMAGRTVTIKVKYRDFVQVTRSLTLAEPVADDKALYQTGRLLLAKTEIGSRPIRLLGISLANLCPAEAHGQLALFGKSRTREKDCRLYQAIDTISDRYGSGSIVPATLVERREEEQEEAKT
ncbi:MAG: DNA polymerase IV [Desulfobulbaceae bacterium]|nr:DNA polymerase IV [Desulfobulbaceae bacterium]HIJ90619.1 DNA polymerase IV [Deltaproteobacteria bacterium]